MDSLQVYADWLGLDGPRLVGTLSRDALRGGETYGFRFNDAWLPEHGGIRLSADLQNFSGWQYSPPGSGIFGCFADALPDRWGRTLLQRRELLLAKQEGRPRRHLTSFDYLLGIDDGSRMGGFRFALEEGGAFINTSGRFRIPPLSDIRLLEQASLQVEKHETSQEVSEIRWLDQLVHPGSSLGGARPKANVRGEDKTLYIAKFPSRNDAYDVARYEHEAHELACSLGICCAQTRLLKTEGRHHTLLSRRFDRVPEGRVHFASALSLLGLQDGSNATTGHGYLDIVDFILEGCTRVEDNLKELYRRVAFNIGIGNTDDHFRNHGFLLEPQGWTLSPAYDMNPTSGSHLSLLIDGYSSERDFDTLLKAHGDYLLGRQEAEAIVRSVEQATKGRFKNIP